MTLWLTAAFLVINGCWGTRFVPLVLLSIIVDYLIGIAIDRASARRRLWLGLPGYFKYANFFIATLEAVGGVDWAWTSVVLPIGISFFTFQQIAYLVDIYRPEAFERDPWRYALFVTFFPQLIAGPIVHHREMMPQFARQSTDRRAHDLVVGIVILAIGLAKKVVIADGVAEAWAGALAFGLQIYFDFSGYSDMAVGLGRMFGITLPINFAAPCKVNSIIHFWQRWHITLSRFLRGYLYIPLAGGRHGARRRYRNVFLTMALGGIWHGAGWAFLLWGVLHGLFIIANHLWRRTWRGRDLPIWAGRLLTFALVTIAWVPFRAADLSTTLTPYTAMAGLGGATAATAWPLASTAGIWLHLSTLMAVARLVPHTAEIMASAVRPLPTPAYPPLERLMTVARPAGWPTLRPTLGWAVAVALLLALLVFRARRHSSPAFVRRGFFTHCPTWPNQPWSGA